MARIQTAAPLKNEATRTKIQHIMAEMQQVVKARETLIPGMWVAVVARQHLLQVAKGGTAKSFVTRELVKHIEGAKYFEVAFDETTTPDQISGPPDIKTMVENGRTRRVTTHMLPEAHFAFLDEFFNGNKPALHHVMPLLNERVFHNDGHDGDDSNGEPTKIPLRTAFMGTNQLNSDAAVAWVWDRVHHRHVVDYIQDRDLKRQMIAEATHRRMLGYAEPIRTTVTLDELDAAHNEAMTLEVPNAIWEVFLDLIDEVGRAGVQVSDRRQVEAMAGCLAQAWLNGHSTVRIGDLVVLQHMLWNTLEEAPKVKAIVLAACNPGEKKAMDLLDTLDKLKTEFNDVKDLDKVKLNAAAIDIFKKCDRLLTEANPLKKQADEAGASTVRIDELLDGCTKLKHTIGKDVFGLDEAALAGISTR